MSQFSNDEQKLLERIAIALETIASAVDWNGYGSKAFRITGPITITVKAENQFNTNTVTPVGPPPMMNPFNGGMPGGGFNQFQ